MEQFTEDLIGVINKHSMENASNTPDFILGEFLKNCLRAWDEAVQQRETWYKRDPRPTLPACAPSSLTEEKYRIAREKILKVPATAFDAQACMFEIADDVLNGRDE